MLRRNRIVVSVSQHTPAELAWKREILLQVAEKRNKISRARMELENMWMKSDL